MSFWDNQLKAELSQGDLLSFIPVLTSVHPKTPLVRALTKKGGVNDGWNVAEEFKADGDGLIHGLARGRFNCVVVLTEDCEIDKPGGKLPVQVAPVFPISLVHADQRDSVRQRKRFPFFPLEPIPGSLDVESYVDLRQVTHINRKIVHEATRLQSMNATGVRALQLQIFGFFTHRTIEQMANPPAQA